MSLRTFYKTRWNFLKFLINHKIQKNLNRYDQLVLLSFVIKSWPHLKTPNYIVHQMSPSVWVPYQAIAMVRLMQSRSNKVLM